MKYQLFAMKPDDFVSYMDPTDPNTTLVGLSGGDPDGVIAKYRVGEVPAAGGEKTPVLEFFALREGKDGVWTGVNYSLSSPPEALIRSMQTKLESGLFSTAQAVAALEGYHGYNRANTAGYDPATMDSAIRTLKTVNSGGRGAAEALDAIVNSSGAAAGR